MDRRSGDQLDQGLRLPGQEQGFRVDHRRAAQRRRGRSLRHLRAADVGNGPLGGAIPGRTRLSAAQQRLHFAVLRRAEFFRSQPSRARRQRQCDRCAERLDRSGAGLVSARHDALHQAAGVSEPQEIRVHLEDRSQPIRPRVPRQGIHLRRRRPLQRRLWPVAARLGLDRRADAHQLPHCLRSDGGAGAGRAKSARCRRSRSTWRSTAAAA